LALSRRFGQALRPKQKPLIFPWAASELKRQDEEHRSAEQERLVVQEGILTPAVERGPAVRLPWLSIPAAATYAVISAPAVMACLAFASGFGPHAIAVTGVLPLIALLTGVSSGLGLPVNTFAKSSPESPPLLLSEEPMSLTEARCRISLTEALATLSQLLLGASGLVQATMTLMSVDTAAHARFVITGMLCAVAQITMAVIWTSSSFLRVAQPTLDSMATEHRYVRHLLFQSTERVVDEHLDALRLCQAPPYMSIAKDQVKVASGNPLESHGASCLTTAVRVTCNTVGVCVRHSPLKILLVTTNAAIVTEVVTSTLPHTVAWTAAISAALTLVTMTDFVRAITSELEYAECLRHETERRQLLLKRDAAEANLSVILQLSEAEIDPTTLSLAIEAAEQNLVPKSTMAMAKGRLEIISALAEQREEDSKRKLSQERERREAALKALTGLILAPLLEVDLSRLMSALDEARVAGVPRQEISKAEDFLKAVANKQGQRAQAESRLRSYVDIGETSPGQTGPITVGTQLCTKPAARRTVDFDELGEAIQEAIAAGADSTLCDKAVVIQREALAAQLGAGTGVAKFASKLRQQSKMSNWRETGGGERLHNAVASAGKALDMLRKDKEANPLSAAAEDLSLALEEARAVVTSDSSLVIPNLSIAEATLVELNAAIGELDMAHWRIERAITVCEKVSTYEQLLDAELMLSEAIPVATSAYVDDELVSSAETKLHELRQMTRSANAAEERLTSAIAFCSTHLQRFFSKKPSQLKLVAVPALIAAISHGKTALVQPMRIVEGEEMLREARGAEHKADEASQWLSSACKSAVTALTRALQEQDAGSILQAAQDSLISAITTAREQGVDSADVASAEQLLSTLRQSTRRATLRAGGNLPVLPPTLAAQYSHVLGPDH
jgi:flagellar biosynthesis chaperone FliJ